MDWVKNSEMYQGRENEVSGIILAGGKGKRLGSPKALIKIGGESLLLRTVNLLRSLFSEVLVVAGDKGLIPDIPGIVLLQDEVAGMGPIGGLITALKNMKNERGFCVACDMPLLDKCLIQYLVSLSNSRETIVPCVAGQIEPLHAIYSRKCLEIALRRISRRQYSLTGLILSVSAHCVHIPLGPGALPFFNINTPQDLTLAEQTCAETEKERPGKLSVGSKQPGCLVALREEDL